MCDPVTSILAGISAAASVGGTAVSAYANNKAIKAQNEAAARKAEQERKNSEIAVRKAGEIIDYGRNEANDYRVRVASLVGSQRAAFSASGVDVNSGSAIDLQSQTLAFGELDAMDIAYNASEKSRELRERGGQMLEQANIDEASKRGSGLSTAATLLGGTSNLASIGLAAKSLDYKYGRAGT